MISRNRFNIQVFFFFVVIGITFLIFICPLKAEKLDEFYIYDVPYVAQADTYWCGPASLSMILNYWGYEINQSTIAIQIYDSTKNLTSISNMTLFPIELGFQTENISHININDLKIYINKGIPVIVLQKFSKYDDYGHFRIVVGYNEINKVIIVDDPILGENHEISYQSFTDLWLPGSTFKTTNWALIVKPKNEVLRDLMENYQIELNKKSDFNVTELDEVYIKIIDWNLNKQLRWAVLFLTFSTLSLQIISFFRNEQELRWIGYFLSTLLLLGSLLSIKMTFNYYRRVANLENKLSFNSLIKKPLYHNIIINYQIEIVIITIIFILYLIYLIRSLASDRFEACKW